MSTLESLDYLLMSTPSSSRGGPTITCSAPSRNGAEKQSSAKSSRYGKSPKIRAKKSINEIQFTFADPTSVLDVPTDCSEEVQGYADDMIVLSDQYEGCQAIQIN